MYLKNGLAFFESAIIEMRVRYNDFRKGSSKIAYTVISSCAQYLFPVMLVISLYLSIYLKLRNRPQVR